MLTYWVAFSHMIPISLYVIIEVLKLGQGYLINNDVKMYHKDTKNFAKCRNSDLTEELGQVEMIFSDKTGTLTMNKMVFKKCHINGLKFGEPERGETLEGSKGMVDSGINKIKEQLSLESKAKQKGAELPEGFVNVKAEEFFLLLTLCHSVVCDDDPVKKDIRYQASSPDELALVKGARSVGMKFLSRNHGKIEVRNDFTGEVKVYKVVEEFPFDSTRKCMSVLIKDDKGNTTLYSKGADSVMMEKIMFEKSPFKNMQEKVEHALHRYSCHGLRTLVMAKRNVGKEEYSTLKKILKQLKESNHPLKDKKIKSLYEQMEKKMTYVGCSAIEDKLQEGVPATINKLMEADIRFWMLTGDKMETAIEIAKSCRVIQEGMQILQLSTNDFDNLRQQMDAVID